MDAKKILLELPGELHAWLTAAKGSRSLSNHIISLLDGLRKKGGR